MRTVQLGSTDLHVSAIAYGESVRVAHRCLSMNPRGAYLTRASSFPLIIFGFSTFAIESR